MQKNISWLGQDYHSLENCRIVSRESGYEINGTINGNFAAGPYHVDYFIQTNQFWETLAFTIRCGLASNSYSLDFTSDGKGNWSINDQPAAQYHDCIDIDISLTPFTNTLPIKRLKFVPHEKQRITVLYIDVLEQQTRRIDQLYTKLTETLYNYENASNDFQSLLIVDEDGLVVEYPNHFFRNSISPVA